MQRKLAVIFAIAFIVMMAEVIVLQIRRETIVEENETTQEALLFAVDTAAEELISGISGDIKGSLLATSEKFFSSLGIYYGFGQDDIRRTELELYVPVLVVTTEDGFYVAKLQRNTLTGVLSHTWSECIPYTYADDKFTYRLFLNDTVEYYCYSDRNTARTSYSIVSTSPSLQTYFSGSRLFASQQEYDTVFHASVVESIEREVKKALADGSYIAGDCGMRIVYTCPSFIDVMPDNFAAAFMAVYQGFPNTSGIAETGSGVNTASYLVKKETFCVVPANGSCYYAVVHHKDCPLISGSSYTEVQGKEKAIQEFGAYGCPNCIHSWEGFSYAP